MQRVVLAGSANLELGEAIAHELGIPMLPMERRQFPDGEVYVRLLDSVKDHHVLIVQSTCPNDQFVECLLLAEAARTAGAKRITTIVPYFGYARQDQVFKDGEPISARTAARAIGLDSDELLLIDPHKEHIQEYFPGPTHVVSVVEDLAKALRETGVDVLLAPDKGALDRVERAANALGLPYDYLEKTRHSATEVTMVTKQLDVRGKVVAILDDMIASGGTMITAAKQLRSQGAKAVYAACTHGVFTNDAVPKLRQGGFDGVFASDSIEGSDATMVSCARAVAAGVTSLDA